MRQQHQNKAAEVDRNRNIQIYSPNLVDCRDKGSSGRSLNPRLQRCRDAGHRRRVSYRGPLCSYSPQPECLRHHRATVQRQLASKISQLQRENGTHCKSGRRHVLCFDNVRSDNYYRHLSGFIITLLVRKTRKKIPPSTYQRDATQNGNESRRHRVYQ